ncbi:hypothetical protein EMIHUDRAFT_237645 [Emiliania huxleyi CCMP1516]|uniref:ribonuclease P n=2 Tax=Emiliania huxleyi TaxID=2903 RepID=A0A0D3JPT6_EMIH1|nr:hypothetical protein EMIHUDRAFT_237645 [Emiliania huxleyi CCMP1516]EOD25521.1 hypothetical protein EMIHUDRAFT_237645 [Emiliania huxleyi CCMP1516]|eukprot:XP_005777950.1 hypothetical protein EMIHUDRAFT_237645 [Emiliania huxleyi CCMP1516]
MARLFPLFCCLAAFAAPAAALRLGAPLMRTCDASRRKAAGRHLRQLAELQALPAAEACEAAQATLANMRAEGLPLNVDAVSRAISLCGCELPVAESLFESLVAAGNDSEGAYSCLLRAQLGSGDLDRALVTFRRMLQRGIAPRGRNASPVLHALCAAGRQVDAMRFSGRLVRHGLLRRQLDRLLREHSTPGAETAAAIEAAVVAVGGSAAATRVAVGHDGRCPCCGGGLQLLTLPEEQRERVAEVVSMLQRAGKRVLLILPAKYARDVVPNHTSSSQVAAPDDRITAADRALLDGWRSEGLLYTTGPGMYDDWYWMLATVGRGDSQPVAVTNDAMRDHWADLLPARDFARWRASKLLAGRWHVPLPDGAPEGEGGGAPEPVGQWLCVSVVPPPRVRRAGDPQVAVCR